MNRNRIAIRSESDHGLSRKTPVRIFVKPQAAKPRVNRGSALAGNYFPSVHTAIGAEWPPGAGRDTPNPNVHPNRHRGFRVIRGREFAHRAKKVPNVRVMYALRASSRRINGLE